MKINTVTNSQSKNNKLFVVLLCTTFLGFGVYLGWKNVPGFIKANFILLRDSQLIPSLLENNELDTLHLNIPFKNFQKIQSKRLEAIENKRLVRTDDDFVKAEISINGKEQIPCQLRLKGHLSDHWSGDKFSLRVNLKKNNLINGMSTFSIQDPATRSDTLEWAFLTNLKKEGCISIRYYFVNLIINGKKMGIYALEEHFSKEMVEANQRRLGVIGYFDDYFFWKKYPPTFHKNISWQSIYLSAEPKVRETKKLELNPSLNVQAHSTIKLMQALKEKELPASKILDHEETGKFLAITRLWSTNHGLGIDDINFYFNPVTSLLEPIGFDGQSGAVPMECFFSSNVNPWVKYALEDSKIAKSYTFYLNKFSDYEYLLKLKSNLIKEESNYRKLLLAEMLWEEPIQIWKDPKLINNYDPWEELFKRADQIKKELSEDNLTSGYANIDSNSSELCLFIRNTTTQPVELKNIKVGEKVLNHDEIMTSNSNSSYFQAREKTFVLPPLMEQQEIKPKFIRLTLGKYKLNKPEIIEVECRLWGLDKGTDTILYSVETLSFDSDLLPLSSPELQLNGLDFNLLDNKITIEEGNYSVEKNIYIPSGYIVSIDKGTTLNFFQGTTFVSESPILALGTEEKNIEFKSFSENWSGVLLYNTSAYSKFKWLNISDVSGVGKASNQNGQEINGWNMTGGITAYKSPIEFENCHFKNFQTEDALNIISSTFTLNKCTFVNLYSDAFDGDFVTGNLKQCVFKDVNGDGVDFSGSLVMVEKCVFKNIKDKAISVGENSSVNINSCSIDSVSYGVVSKDLSETIVASGTKITNASNAAFAAFQKKETFGPASISVFNTNIMSCNKRFLIQNGSIGKLDGELLPNEVFDTKELYEN